MAVFFHQNAMMSFQTMYLIYIFIILFYNFWVYAHVCHLTADIHTVNFMTVILLQTVRCAHAAVCIKLHVNV